MKAKGIGFEILVLKDADMAAARGMPLYAGPKIRSNSNLLEMISSAYRFDNSAMKPLLKKDPTLKKYGLFFQILKRNHLITMHLTLEPVQRKVFHFLT